MSFGFFRLIVYSHKNNNFVCVSYELDVERQTMPKLGRG